MVKSVRGSIRTHLQQSRQGHACFNCYLPLTLSVLRTLLVEVAGEPYAFPLSQINRTMKLSKNRIETLDGRQHFMLGELPQRIGRCSPAHHVLDYRQPQWLEDEVPVVTCSGDRTGPLWTRRGPPQLGERELVVQPLDSRLGKNQGHQCRRVDGRWFAGIDR